MDTVKTPTLTRAQLFLETERAALNSVCKLDKVGSLLYDPVDGRYVIGWNQVAGNPNAACECQRGHTLPTVIHSEIVTFKKAKALFTPEALRRSILFVTRRPCARCAPETYALGVQAVFYRDGQPDMRPMDFLAARGVITGQWQHDNAVIDNLLARYL